MMWPGIPPRLGLPLLVFYDVFYGWYLAELHPHSSRFWWAAIGVVGLAILIAAVLQWHKHADLAEALAQGSHPDPAVREQADRVARQLDDHPRYSTWSFPLLLVIIASPGIPAAVRRGDLLFAVPCAALLAYAAVMTVLLRRRERQAAAWLAQRPREPDWRSVPPS